MRFPSILGILGRSATEINVKQGTAWIKFEKGERDREGVINIKKNIKQDIKRGIYKKGVRNSLPTMDCLINLPAQL